MTLVQRVRAILPPQYRQFAKFLVVGGTGWVIDAGVYTVLTHTLLSEHVIFSKVISMLISTLFTYVFNREWSFNTRGGRQLPHEATLFFVFNGIGFLINLIPLIVTDYIIGISIANGYGAWTVTVTNWIMANVVGTFIAMLFRYWSYRKFVFPEEIGASTAASASVSASPSTSASAPARTSDATEVD